MVKTIGLTNRITKKKISLSLCYKHIRVSVTETIANTRAVHSVYLHLNWKLPVAAAVRIYIIYACVRILYVYTYKYTRKHDNKTTWPEFQCDCCEFAVVRVYIRKDVVSRNVIVVERSACNDNSRTTTGSGLNRDKVLHVYSVCIDI